MASNIQEKMKLHSFNPRVSGELDTGGPLVANNVLNTSRVMCPRHFLRSVSEENKTHVMRSLPNGYAHVMSCRGQKLAHVTRLRSCIL